MEAVVSPVSWCQLIISPCLYSDCAPVVSGTRQSTRTFVLVEIMSNDRENVINTLWGSLFLDVTK